MKVLFHDYKSVATSEIEVCSMDFVWAEIDGRKVLVLDSVYAHTAHGSTIAMSPNCFVEGVTKAKGKPEPENLIEVGGYEERE